MINAFITCPYSSMSPPPLLFSSSSARSRDERRCDKDEEDREAAAHDDEDLRRLDDVSANDGDDEEAAADVEEAPWSLLSSSSLTRRCVEAGVPSDGTLSSNKLRVVDEKSKFEDEEETVRAFLDPEAREVPSRP